MKTDTYKTADAARLEALASRALNAVGISRTNADLVAEILIDADLRGIKSHGVMNLYQYYVKKVQDGIIKAEPDITLQQCTKTTALIDADNGLGFLASHRAMSHAVSMAEEYGTGWVNVYNSTHNGAGSYYVNMAAEAGMIGMVFSTGGTSVAAPGAPGKLIGNNVIAVAAPAENRAPFIFDMAPTMSISNKAHLMDWNNETMPEGFVIDKNGRPVTDPAGYFDKESAVLPLGSSFTHGVHKGFGLLLTVDILAGMLSGDGGSMLRKKGTECHAFFALKADGGIDADHFRQLMSEMIGRLHAAPVFEGSEPLRYPGEKAARTRAERRNTGIPLHPKIAQELELMCSSLGLACDIWIS